MQIVEFSSHKDEKNENGEKIVSQTYRLFTEEGRFAGICVMGELSGRIYRREDEESDEETYWKTYRKAVNTFARENPSALKAFMTEIRGDNKYFQIARSEIEKMLKDLQSMPNC